MRKAREQIDREKRLAIQELRGQVADLAVEAASRIVTSSLTPDAQRKLVNEFIDKLPGPRLPAGFFAPRDQSRPGCACPGGGGPCA